MYILVDSKYIQDFSNIGNKPKYDEIDDIILREVGFLVR